MVFTGARIGQIAARAVHVRCESFLGIPCRAGVGFGRERRDEYRYPGPRRNRSGRTGTEDRTGQGRGCPAVCRGSHPRHHGDGGDRSGRRPRRLLPTPRSVASRRRVLWGRGPAVGSISRPLQRYRARRLNRPGPSQVVLSAIDPQPASGSGPRGRAVDIRGWRDVHPPSGKSGRLPAGHPDLPAGFTTDALDDSTGAWLGDHSRGGAAQHHAHPRLGAAPSRASVQGPARRRVVNRLRPLGTARMGPPGER